MGDDTSREAWTRCERRDQTAGCQRRVPRHRSRPGV